MVDAISKAKNGRIQVLIISAFFALLVSLAIYANIAVKHNLLVAVFQVGLYSFAIYAFIKAESYARNLILILCLLNIIGLIYELTRSFIYSEIETSLINCVFLFAFIYIIYFIGSSEPYKAYNQFKTNGFHFNKISIPELETIVPEDALLTIPIKGYGNPQSYINLCHQIFDTFQLSDLVTDIYAEEYKPNQITIVTEEETFQLKFYMQSQVFNTNFVKQLHNKLKYAYAPKKLDIVYPKTYWYSSTIALALLEPQEFKMLQEFGYYK